jgi:probable phosphoglycerate mutase
MQDEIISKPFYFIRHGQTDWNIKGLKTGQQDIPLNDEGINQAHDAAKYLQGLGIENIIASPLKRAIQTADVINGYLKLPLFYEDGLKEFSSGVYEGQKVEDSFTKEKWIAGFIPEGGESFVDFKNRVAGSVNHIIENYNNPLIVAHSGVFWVLKKILNEDVSYPDNCIAYYFQPSNESGERWIIEPVVPSDKANEL